jgi:hypothetical protein
MVIRGHSSDRPRAVGAQHERETLRKKGLPADEEQTRFLVGMGVESRWLWHTNPPWEPTRLCPNTKTRAQTLPDVYVKCGSQMSDAL